MEALAGYLFVHFTGEHKDGEQVYFSISRDGRHWKDLNGGKPVLRSQIGEKGIRDPFIIKSIDGQKYYIIATDLRIEAEKGWEVAQYAGSKSIIIWESEDLVHWSKEWAVEVGIPGAGCVWAPEGIYNEKTGDYLVFWASMVKEGGDREAKQRIYCSTTKDFHSFSQAQKYIEKEEHIIDTTIVKDEQYYYRISKNETTKNIKIDQGEDLLEGPFQEISAPSLEGLMGVEGPAAFRVNGTKRWCLMVDQFATDGGYLPLITENLAGGEFEILPPESYHLGDTKKRHGSVLNLSNIELELLMENYL